MKLILIGGNNNIRIYQEESKILMENVRYNDSLAWPEIARNEPLTQQEQFQKGIDLARIAQERQVPGCLVVLTHSDHVFNGVRCAVLRGLLSHAEVEFRCCAEGKETIALSINAGGRFSNWPAEFFSQSEVELSELLDRMDQPPSGGA